MRIYDSKKHQSLEKNVQSLFLFSVKGCEGIKFWSILSLSPRRMLIAIWNYHIPFPRIKCWRGKNTRHSSSPSGWNNDSNQSVNNHLPGWISPASIDAIAIRTKINLTTKLDERIFSAVLEANFRWKSDVSSVNANRVYRENSVRISGRCSHISRIIAPYFKHCLLLHLD